MGMQVVVVAKSVAEVTERLGCVAPFAEIFPLPSGFIGVSIPLGVVDDFGEEVVLERISNFQYFDLWAGIWTPPKSK